MNQPFDTRGQNIFEHNTLLRFLLYGEIECGEKKENNTLWIICTPIIYMVAFMVLVFQSTIVAIGMHNKIVLVLVAKHLREDDITEGCRILH